MKRIAGVIAGIVLFTSVVFAQPRLTDPKTYKRYIDPLLLVKDFGTTYFDDGAGDATVLFPPSHRDEYPMPAKSVLDILRLREKAFPILIDCLADGRLTHARFGGNSITKEMLVPVGFVCLDMLTVIAPGPPAAINDCDFDGMGACMNDGYYFWPDDYRRCWDSECDLKPWNRIVQKNWRRAYLSKRLRFRDPYKSSRIPEYKDLLSEDKP